MSELIRQVFQRLSLDGVAKKASSSQTPAESAPQDVHIAAVVSASREGLQTGQPDGVGAVFIDRDGVFNLTEMPVGTPAALKPHLIPGSVEAIARLTHHYPGKIILVTNQSYLSRAPQFVAQEEAVQRLLAQLVAEKGGRFHAMYYCPNPKNFTPQPGHEGGRKPEAGMLLAAAHHDPGIDLSKSYMVGDQTTDLQAGSRADPAVTKIFVQTGHGGADGKVKVEPDHVARDLSAAVDWIIAREQGNG